MLPLFAERKGKTLQIKALNEFKEIVYAWEELSKGDTYYCPHCNSEMIYRKGEINHPHFAHKTLVDCPFSGENESKEHYQMKKQFFDFLRKKYPNLKIELENCLVPNRRADMVIYGRSQILVVEFQASKIEFKEVKERTQDYNKLGHPVLWIFHIQRFGYEHFHTEKKRKQIPYELVEMLRLDSLFVMDNKGFIQRCSGKKTPKTKKVCEYSFFPVKMDFKFNSVMRSNNNESLFLCQLGKDSIYSKKNLCYGYRKTGSENLFSELKEILPSTFFKVEKIKHHNNFVAFLLFMEDDRNQIVSNEFLLSKKKMDTESILDHFKRSNQSQISKSLVQESQKKLKSDKKDVVKNVAINDQDMNSKEHIKIKDKKNNDSFNIPLENKGNEKKLWLTILVYFKKIFSLK
ncbi:competence protein CoiA [Bacillus atrophaeus]|uniref:competence protein CoiA n=1 Tax=Bacillus atrophaeus TaxID=1452 RepID=UPI002281C168|nr:competence protein CoiA family protein [Bacillus atrophaeus]MCY8807797.1 competence protein CoiA [Bacillus atrophaeus]